MWAKCWLALNAKMPGDEAKLLLQPLLKGVNLEPQCVALGCGFIRPLVCVNGQRNMNCLTNTACTAPGQ